MNGSYQASREGLAFRRMGALSEDQEALFHELRSDDVWAGSEAVKRSRNNWGRRFERFRVEILQQDVTARPTAQDVRDFIIKWCMSTSSSHEKEVLRFNTVCYGVRLLREFLAQRFGAYTFNEAESSQIRGCIQKLEQRGLISRQPLVPRKPIGILLIRRLVSTMIRNAIWNGTRNWSFEMQDIAIVVIMASLNARAGDLVKAKDYNPVVAAPFLTYGDIQLVVTRKQDVTSIKGRWRMRNCKGEKIDPTKWFYIHRNALQEHTDSLLCPVRLLLVLAMRTGNVHRTNLEALLNRADEHQDKMIEWVDPKLPVFAKRDGKKKTFCKDKAAEHRFVWEVLRKASQLSGSSHIIRPHDIRGGAAVDLVTMSSQLQGSALPKVASELNHSEAARANGITRLYTRAYTTQDTWALRTSITEQDQPFRDVTFSAPINGVPAVPRRKPKEKSALITEECLRVGKDPKARVDRQAASYRVNRMVAKEVPSEDDHSFTSIAPPPLKSAFEDDASTLPKASRRVYTDDMIKAECERLKRDSAQELERTRAKARLKEAAGRLRKKDASSSNQASSIAQAAPQQPEKSAGLGQQMLPYWEDTLGTRNTSLRDFLISTEYARWGENLNDYTAKRRVASQPRLPELSALDTSLEDPLATISKLQMAVVALATECGNLRKGLSMPAGNNEQVKRKRETNVHQPRNSKKVKLSTRDDSGPPDPIGSVSPQGESSQKALFDGAPSPTAHPANVMSEECSMQDQSITEQEPTILDLVSANDNEENREQLEQLMNTSLDNMAYETTTPPNDPEALKALVSSNFVDHFARVNIVCLSRKVLADKPPPITWRIATEVGADQMNSIVAPTQFLHRCRFYRHGCEYTSPDPAHLDDHEGTCYLREGPMDGDDRCPWPKSCPVTQCLSERAFRNEADLRAHLVLDHPAKGALRTVPSTLHCPVRGCSATKSSNSFLRQHLREMHGLDGVEIEQLCPALTAFSQQCLYPHCTSDEYFNRKGYFKHLDEHNVMQVAEKWEYTKDRVLGHRAPLESGLREDEDEEEYEQ